MAWLYWLLCVLHAILLECSPDPDDPDKDCKDTSTSADVRAAPDTWGKTALWWKEWLIDPARLLILILSPVLITYASQRAVKLDQESKDEQPPEGVHNLAWWHVVCLPLMGSLMLVIFFYFFETIQFFYTILCIIASVVAMYNMFQPAIEKGSKCFKPQTHGSWPPAPFCSQLATVLLSIVLTSLWVLTGHWICLDVLGGALCILMIQFIRVPSLKISTLLLGGLLVYDVFWVFYSSSIFKANVMVEVALKKARNPIAVVAHKLNLPEVAKARPPLSIPGKLLVPSLAGAKGFAMLGLGDIVLPGLLLCFAMRFDRFCQTSGNAFTNGSQKCTKCLLFCQRWSYFSVALAGYASGLILASVVADLSGAPQPALLYLVPAVLTPLFAKATLQGDLGAMWRGPFSNSKAVKGYQQVSQYSLLPL